MGDQVSGCVDAAMTRLRRALALLGDEIRNYPTPVAGCDAQYNYLLGERQKILDALSALERPAFVPTPRTLVEGHGVESR